MRLVSIATVPILIAAGLTATPTATADCTSSAGTSVCSQGTCGREHRPGPRLRADVQPQLLLVVQQRRLGPDLRHREAAPWRRWRRRGEGRRR